MRRVHIRISGGFVLLAVWFGLANGWGVLAAVLTAAVLHELGHWLVLCRLGARPWGIHVRLLGAVMEGNTAGLSYGGELWAVLAGPAVNLVCGTALAVSGREALLMPAGAHLALGLFNLLPVRPLDGGRALALLLCWQLGPERGERLSDALGGISALLLALLLGRVMQETGGSLWLLPPWAGLLAAGGGAIGRAWRDWRRMSFFCK